MRKHWVVLGLVLIFLVSLSQSALAAPYWVKPGVQITYIAHRDNDYIQQQIEKGSAPETIRTASMIYYRNSTYYTIYAHNTSTLTFNITTISNGYATVNIYLNLRNVTVYFEIPNRSDMSPFWDKRDVLNSTCGQSHNEKDMIACVYKLKRLEFGGKYKIRLNDSAVFSLDGEYYGKTFLWADPLDMPNNGTVLYMHGNTTLRVENVYSTQTSMKTYAGSFGPPLLWIYTNKVSVKVGPAEAEGMNVYVYDASDYYVLLSWFGLTGVPDFEAAGMPIVSLSDEAAAKNGVKTLGPMLYSFSPVLGNKKNPVQDNVSRSTTITEPTGVESLKQGKIPTKYIFYGLLTILAAFGAYLLLRRKHHEAD